ncbi:MAG TPA: hypothetical protein VEB21_21475 [Terriglobales bacterium]|nr:hypothetical protein [Terriglobales bacterium]
MISRQAAPAVVRGLAVAVVLLHFLIGALQPTDGTAYVDLPSRLYAFRGHAHQGEAEAKGGIDVQSGDLLIAVRGRAVRVAADLAQTRPATGAVASQVGVTILRAEAERRVETNLPRPELGVLFSELPPGLLIVDVYDAELDLKRGDVITKMDGSPFPLPLTEQASRSWHGTVRNWLFPFQEENPHAYQGDRWLGRIGAGGLVTYAVVRKGETRLVRVPVGRRGLDMVLTLSSVFALALLLTGISFLCQPQLGFPGVARAIAGWLIAGFALLNLFFSASPTLSAATLLGLDGSLVLLALAIAAAASPPRWPRQAEV